MSVARVTEITSTSNESFEDAIRSGIERASKTVRNIASAWVQEQKVLVTDGKVSGFQVNMKVTFVLDDTN
jgi:flavin-binding protein dodecin